MIEGVMNHDDDWETDDEDAPVNKLRKVLLSYALPPSLPPPLPPSLPLALSLSR